ncbi:macrophage-expressed gene 1 protein-like [Anneissia japonica]|uniref:macrophage-expressed gene 1 protein-like n=1 Tax=Anneissia japonica TaxID=1529436 RepID=UPI001425A0F2|nr:macrophage-expressed gene 1 protein-like [Anneissia japonica]
MYKYAYLLVLMFLMSGTEGVETGTGFVDRKTCRTDVNYFEVLPGTGYDNLRNVDMGQLVLNSYDSCRLTEDRQYLVPDDVIFFPIKHSEVELFAELFEHWLNYTSVSSKSINAYTSYGPSISGSFSEENESVKKHQVYGKSSTIRVQVRHHLYTVRLNNPTLHPAFKSRVVEIGTHYNDTRMARYLTQLLVRDYGTHVVTAVDVGGIFLQQDHVRNNFVRDHSSDKNEIKAAASAMFWEISAGVGFNTSVNQAILESYLKSRTYSKYQTFGGGPYRVKQTINDWQDGLPNNLVAIDRHGDPLHYMITTNTLPDVPAYMVHIVSDLILEEVERYYEVNKHVGCTNMDSINFNFRANHDDKSCAAPYNNYTFGGVYQKCEMQSKSLTENVCSKLSQKNPLTGDFSCPDGYEAVQLNSGYDFYTITKTNCRERCRFFSFFCKNVCEDIHDTTKFVYRTFWCAATSSVPARSGYLFGGVYTFNMANPLTETNECPNTFLPLRMGVELFACVSSDYELGYRYSIPFGGFFSCSAGNPLALPGSNTYVSDSISKESSDISSTFIRETGPGGWPKRCPTGYSRHLATIDNDCEIDFCVEEKALSYLGLPPIQRPPYSRKPLGNYTAIETMFNQPTNITNSAGYGSMPDDNQEMYGDKDKNDTQNTIIVLSLLSAILISILIAIAMMYRRNRRRSRSSLSPTTSNEGNTGVSEDTELLG